MIAALFWGLAYALLGKVMHSGISSAFALSFIGAFQISAYLLVLLKSETLQAGIDILAQNKIIIVCMIAVAACLVSGQFLIYKAISLKDAPHVVILEISYPVFTCLFTWLLFRNLELSWQIIVGGTLIFMGSALVLFKSSH